MNIFFALSLIGLGVNAESAHQKYRILIKAEMIKNESTFQNCYNTILKTEPNAQGKLVVDFFISSDGSTKDINLNSKRSKFSNDALFKCLQAAISKIHFPKIENEIGYQTSYPFKFSNK